MGPVKSMPFGAKYQLDPCNIIPVSSLPVCDLFRDILVLIFFVSNAHMLAMGQPPGCESCYHYWSVDYRISLFPRVNLYTRNKDNLITVYRC